LISKSHLNNWLPSKNICNNFFYCILVSKRLRTKIMSIWSVESMNSPWINQTSMLISSVNCCRILHLVSVFLFLPNLCLKMPSRWITFKQGEKAVWIPKLSKKIWCFLSKLVCLIFKSKWQNLYRFQVWRYRLLKTWNHKLLSKTILKSLKLLRWRSQINCWSMDTTSTVLSRILMCMALAKSVCTSYSLNSLRNLDSIFHKWNKLLFINRCLAKQTRV